MFKHIRKSEDKGIIEAGFTLVELLVVIAILGILAVVGVLSFNGLTDSAKSATNKTELTQVQTAVDAKAAATGTAAADDTSLEVADLAGYIKTGTVFQCAYSVSGGEVTQGACA